MGNQLKVIPNRASTGVCSRASLQDLGVDSTMEALGLLRSATVSLHVRGLVFGC